MADRTSSNRAAGRRAAWASVLAGTASVAALPLAIYATRFSESYELVHAALAIPVAVVLAVAGLKLARGARRRDSLGLGRSGPARVGRLLALLGLCLVATALVALAVYGLLEYMGSR